MHNLRLVSVAPSVGVKHSLWLDSEAIISASSYVGNSICGSGVMQSLWGVTASSYVGKDGVTRKFW